MGLFHCESTAFDKNSTFRTRLRCVSHIIHVCVFDMCVLYENVMFHTVCVCFILGMCAIYSMYMFHNVCLCALLVQILD